MEKNTSSYIRKENKNVNIYFWRCWETFHGKWKGGGGGGGGGLGSRFGSGKVKVNIKNSNN